MSVRLENSKNSTRYSEYSVYSDIDEDTDYKKFENIKPFFTSNNKDVLQPAPPISWKSIFKDIIGFILSYINKPSSTVEMISLDEVTEDLYLHTPLDPINHFPVKRNLKKGNSNPIPKNEESLYCSLQLLLGYLGFQIPKAQKIIDHYSEEKLLDICKKFYPEKVNTLRNHQSLSPFLKNDLVTAHLILKDIECESELFLLNGLPELCHSPKEIFETKDFLKSEGFKTKLKNHFLYNPDIPVLIRNNDYTLAILRFRETSIGTYEICISDSRRQSSEDGLYWLELDDKGNQIGLKDIKENALTSTAETLISFTEQDNWMVLFTEIKTADISLEDE